MIAYSRAALIVDLKCQIFLKIVETIHPTENSILLILFKIPFIVTYVDILFLTSEGMEAERGPKLFSEGQKPFSEGKESMKK